MSQPELVTPPLKGDYRPVKFPEIVPRKDPSKTMTAVEWHGDQDMRVVVRPRPMITEPNDVLVRVTTTTICGSDLHLYHHEVSAMQRGDVLGHEFMGIIEDVGSEVKNIKKGDRVVVSAVISCGQCNYCKLGYMSCCDCTNPSKEMEELYGHDISGIFGYSHLTGGYDGGQAEYVRVPYGDVNCLKITSNIPDEKVLFLSDIACTGWHAVDLAGVGKGHRVAIWGLGPVGLMAAMWAKFRGAEEIYGIDAIPARLDKAAQIGVRTIDFSKEDVVSAIKRMCPGGPDVSIDAAGFRFPKSLLHRMERAMRIESDAPDILAECITCTRKHGVVSVVGDYFYHANAFPIGAFMEKALTMRSGQVFVQKYWKELLRYIEEGKVDPTFVITHRMPLEKASDAYRMFDRKEDGAIKIILKPSGLAQSH
jgi:threonine dehydrogenase-like Zn-dependent dehydrogenase